MSVRTRAEVLNEWDAIRAKIADGCTNDGPRLWLEGVLDDFDIEIERLRSALAAEREWQPIVTAPHDRDASVLIWDSVSMWVASWVYDDQWQPEGQPSFAATHWMPLPQPPEKGKKMTGIKHDSILDGDHSVSRIQFGSNPMLLTFNTNDGTIEIGEGLKPDEAGRQALEAMKAAYADWFREAIATEREACAKVADAFADVSARIEGGISKSTTSAGIANVAAAIRARK